MKSQSQIYSRYFTYIKPFAKLPIVKTYGSTIFTLLVMTIFIFYAIKPTVETILVLQKKITDSTQVLERVTQKANTLSLAKQNYEKLDPTVTTKIETAIPDKVNLKSLIQILEQTAKNHEATVSALQIQPLTIETNSPTGVGTLTEISFTFNCQGEYKNLNAMLKDLKNSGRLISIDNLSLSRINEGGGLIMSITGKGYYIK